MVLMAKQGVPILDGRWSGMIMKTPLVVDKVGNKLEQLRIKKCQWDWQSR